MLNGTMVHIRSEKYQNEKFKWFKKSINIENIVGRSRNDKLMAQNNDMFTKICYLTS